MQLTLTAAVAWQWLFCAVLTSTAPLSFSAAAQPQLRPFRECRGVGAKLRTAGCAVQKAVKVEPSQL